jgi:hypothetical protein
MGRDTMAKTAIIEAPGGPEQFRIVDMRWAIPDRGRSASGTTPAA